MFSYLLLSISLFIIGTIGMYLFKKHVINILISLELIILSLNINFVIFSSYLDDLLGQLYALMVLTVAAAESSLGLALIIVFYRLRGGISIDLLYLLKG